MELLISLIAGAVGGNVAGGLLKNAHLGFILNSIVGVAGGGLGAQILSVLGPLASIGGSDTGAIVGHVAAGAAGGAALVVLAGLIRRVITK